MEDGWFDLTGAREAAAQGRLVGWVDLHLRQPGGNPALAHGLRLAPRVCEGPIQVPLSALERCCGPEPGTEYPEPAERWEARVLALAAHVRAGGRLAPLIVQRRGGGLSVRDGNHRLGALERLPGRPAWVLVWPDAPTA